MTTQAIARLERKNHKDYCLIWVALAIPLLFMSAVVAGTLPPTSDVMSEQTFKTGKICLYFIFVGLWMFCVFKATVNYLSFKAIKL